MILSLRLSARCAEFSAVVVHSRVAAVERNFIVVVMHARITAVRILVFVVLGSRITAIRVLIVDDEDDFRDTIVKRLKVRKLEAESASTGAAALALLAVNVVFSEEVMGARNWLSFGGYSFQPSEFVKVLYLYVGASTLDRLYRKQNLFVFMAFSAISSPGKSSP